MMLKYLASEQWGSIIIGTISIVMMIFFRDVDPYVQSSAPFVAMVVIAIISGVARNYLADQGGAELAVARLAETLGVDRQLLGREGKKPLDQQTYQRWQAEHTVVYVGLCEPRIVRGKVQFGDELTMFKARLADVLSWTKDNGFKFFSYNASLGTSELMLWKEGKVSPPDSSALYLHPTSASILILGSSPEEVFWFKPHSDLMEDWRKLFAFGHWRLELDNQKKVVIHDEISKLEETEKDAPIADAYDPTVRGRSAFKKGINIVPSILEEKTRYTNNSSTVEYIK